jgi:hypothetical protein
MRIVTIFHAQLTALLMSGPLGDRARKHVVAALKRVNAML